jgi:hypothetical protein
MGRDDTFGMESVNKILSDWPLIKNDLEPFAQKNNYEGGHV